MNVDDYTTHMRGATKALADIYAEMAEVRSRPTSRKWNESKKQAEIEKLMEKIQENRIYSKHLTTALTHRTPTHDSVVTLSNVDSRIRSIRRALTTAEKLNRPWTKQRRDLDTELKQLLDQRKTIRNAWSGFVHVSLKLTVTVMQNGYMKDLTIDTKTVKCRNTESAKNKAIKGILDDVMNDIKLYQDVVDSRNIIGALHYAHTNPNDPHEMKIELHEDSTIWTPGETMFADVVPIYELPNTAHHANANQAPTIPGLTSHPDEIFGCAVGAFYHYLRTNNHHANKSTIFKQLFGLNLTDNEVVEAPEHVTNNTGRMGASQEEIINYLTNYFPKTVRWYLHVGIQSPIKSDKPKTTNYHTVHFTLDNSHLYIGKRKNNININNLPTEIVPKENAQDIKELIDDFKEEQLLIRMPTTMNEFCVQVVEQTEIIPAVQVGPTGVERVMINDCVYIENDEFEARQKVWNKMQAKYAGHTAFQKKFSDQTATQIAKQLMDVFGLKTDMFESFDNPHAVGIYQENLTGPFQGPIDPFYVTPENLNLADFKKCYFQLVHMLRDERLPVFHARDSFEFTTTEIAQNLVVNSIINAGTIGDVLIKQFSIEGVQISQKVWPSCIVKRIIERKWISHADILAFRESSRSMPVRVIYDFLVQCYNELDEDAFKMVYTRMFGYFGINHEKFCAGQITTSKATRDEALNAGWEAKYLKYDPENHNNIYLIYQESAKPKLENFNPIFRLAACGSTMMLMDMVSTMRDMMPNVHILSGRVDGLYFQNVSETQLANFRAHLGSKTFTIPKYNGQNVIIQRAVLEDKEDVHPQNVIRDFGKSKRKNPYANKTRLGSLTTGFPGVGKSFEMARQAREDVIDSLEPVKILFTTVGHKVKRSMKTVADNLKSEFPLNVEVEVGVLAAYTEQYRKKTLHHKFDFIYVDEYGQLGDEDLKTLYTLHNNYDRCVQRWYGDQNQLKGINRVTLNMHSSALKWLLPTQITLEYKFDGSTKHRLSPELYEEVAKYWETGVLTPKLFARFKRTFEETGLDHCANNLASTNRMCRIVDDKMKKRGLVMEKPWYCTVNKKVKREAPWRPLTESETVEVFNGDLLTEEDRAACGLKLAILDDKGKSKEKPDVVPASCLTAHRIQGTTIDGHWTIWDPLHKKMTRQSMFVMLTRGRELKKLHGVCSNLEALKTHQFPLAKDYEPGCLDYEHYLEAPELKYQARGWIIYRIEDQSLKVSYVGITYCDTPDDDCIDRSEKRRLKEHLDEKIPHGRMTKNAEIETLHWFRAVEHDPKYEDTERFYIEWDIENSRFLNINKRKIDRAIKKKTKPIEVEEPEPEMTDLQRLNNMLTTAGFSPMIVVDDKGKKFLRWCQRYDNTPKGLKPIKRKYAHDRVEWVLYEAVKAWIMGEGQNHEKICRLSLGAEWIEPK